MDDHGFLVLFGEKDLLPEYVRLKFHAYFDDLIQSCLTHRDHSWLLKGFFKFHMKGIEAPELLYVPGMQSTGKNFRKGGVRFKILKKKVKYSEYAGMITGMVGVDIDEIIFLRH